MFLIYIFDIYIYNFLENLTKTMTIDIPKTSFVVDNEYVFNIIENQT